MDYSVTPAVFKLTDRVAALQLDDVHAVLDDSGVRTYELKYVLRDSVYWKIPLTLVDVGITVKVDELEVAESLPLPSPMTVNF